MLFITSVSTVYLEGKFGYNLPLPSPPIHLSSARPLLLCSFKISKQQTNLFRFMICSINIVVCCCCLFFWFFVYEMETFLENLSKFRIKYDLPLYPVAELGAAAARDV